MIIIQNVTLKEGVLNISSKDAFLINIVPSSIPKFLTSNHKTSFIDFYGAVLYKNVWYGKRMVSYDFKQ
jgi:hypothetical protein